MDTTTTNTLYYDILAWEVSSEMIYLYTQLYAVPLVIMLILSAMTVYRREMSCNHVYTLIDNGERTTTKTTSSTNSNGTTATTSSNTVVGEEVVYNNIVDDHHRSNDNQQQQQRLSTDSASQVAIPYSCRPHPSQPTVDSMVDLSCTGRTTSTSAVAWERFISISFHNALETLSLEKNITSVIPLQLLQPVVNSFSRRFDERRKSQNDEPSKPLHPDQFPTDVQVNIMSFLHPKDVVTFGCASKNCQDMIDGNGPVSKAIWKTLWQRDYGWIIQCWEVGRKAHERSNISNPNFGKEFYFRFGLGYINYLLAGLNTGDKCLVGLHGSIYDITDFVLRHPGSPETLYVHAGRDASRFFDDMDHSKAARRLAQNFCIAVDRSHIVDGVSCGLKPTADFCEYEADRPLPPGTEVVDADPVVGKKERRGRHPQSLKKIYEQFRLEERKHRKEFKLAMKAQGNVLHSTIFHDPFRGEWSGWYTTKEFDVVFA